MALNDKNYILGWSDYAANCLLAFNELLRDEEMVDVTLVADGHLIKAHRLILSALSPFFWKMFNQMPANQQAFVVLKDVSKQTADYLVTYIYNGEVNVASECLADFMNVAKALDIKGLNDDSYSQPREFNGVNRTWSNPASNGIQYQSTHINQHLDTESSLDQTKSLPHCNEELKEFQPSLGEFEGDEWIDFEVTNKTNGFDGSLETNDADVTYENDVNVDSISMRQDNDAAAGQAMEEYGSDSLNDLEIEYVSVPTPKRVKRNNDYADYNILANIQTRDDGRENIFYNNYKFYRSTTGNIRQRWACTCNKAKKCKGSISTVIIDGNTMMKVLNGEHTHEPVK